MPRRMNVKLFMFFSSQRGRRPASPPRRTETLTSRAAPPLPPPANGDVDVGAQRPLLHLSVRDAELDDRLPEEPEEAVRLVRGVEIRLGDDLDERRAAPVEVDQAVVGADRPACGAARMHRLRCVL